MTPTPVAVVTGAARGIGAAIALRLAQDGHAVALLDRDAGSCDEVADKVRATGVAAVAVAADVSDEDSVSAAVGAIAEELGSPTVLVNNAGILRDNLLFRMSSDDWDAVSGVHLRGSFLMTRAVQPYMREAGFGRIVCLSSTSALGNRGQANYAAAKAGLQGFVKTLALELGPSGVTANAVAPGFIVTDMTRATAERLGQPFEEFERAKAAAIPVRRGGTPEDVAHTVSYLVDQRSGFVNGQVIYVAGGPRC
ncbi:SDR family oxidoreductase [Mycobacterium sp. PS03-16]|uniref:SDR family oxidoreductase n=1 Tax=Mycobacterium sp. PS03-16 TaxID=2559611 RepID=UPI001073CEF6|nr:SDR family oxidoreductase [Mycobacterium sp. PS03-16]TFV57096.1 SDR family oxidoreductase [Mycobacterium sp. PS03-16]